MVDVFASYMLGLLHGVRHALEPDHVAAVSTVLAEQRSARESVRFAVAWGTGHGLMLVMVGGLLFWFRQEMPPRLADFFELGVAVMLIALGIRALVLAKRSKLPPRALASAHAHRHDARRPLIIGLIHGLAGSGALAAMVMARLPNAFTGLAFMAIYGVGAMCGMATLAGVAGVPLARLLRAPGGAATVMVVTGIFSIGLGLFWGITAIVG